jgi:hypothetical protein
MSAKISKVGRYVGKAKRLSNDFLAYLKENPFVAVGLTVAVGTMAVTMAGGKIRIR